MQKFQFEKVRKPQTFAQTRKRKIRELKTDQWTWWKTWIIVMMEGFWSGCCWILVIFCIFFCCLLFAEEIYKLMLYVCEKFFMYKGFSKECWCTDFREFSLCVEFNLKVRLWLYKDHYYISLQSHLHLSTISWSHLMKMSHKNIWNINILLYS